MSKSDNIQAHTDKYVLLGALDQDTDEIKPLDMEDITGGLAVIQYVWNTTTLQWEKMVQPMIYADDLTVEMGDIEKLLAANYWKEQRYEFSGNNPIYKGLHTTIGAATSNTNWYIWKFTFTGNNPTRIQGPIVGSWDNRASLGW